MAKESKYKEFHLLIEEFGQEVVDNAMRNLGVYRTINGKRRRAVASDNLRKSLSYAYTKRTGILEFYAKGEPGNYADFVEQGVNGTNNSQGSPYSFKKGYIPTQVVLDWMKIKRIPIRDLKGKIIKADEEEKLRVARLISRSIASKGIAPLFYWRDAYNNQVDIFQDKFVEAVRRDIEIYLNDEVKFNLEKNN
ncbi:hypothetical protein UFOVP386_25 [uncultured Caudovirales phage]|uniref:Uncharacterized protein n=1 Tax=uncultured Caudovirales phage TaxID=2100421 RepID=A0A6J7X109_9CAUD|nr:hypothetical protein UFOVP386_25 [uncultured Caudovirales phage]